MNFNHLFFNSKFKNVNVCWLLLKLVFIVGTIQWGIVLALSGPQYRLTINQIMGTSLIFIALPLVLYLIIVRPILVPYLERSRAFEAYFKALTQGAILSRTDARGVITSINENFIKISGYSEAELVGQTHSLINSRYHNPDFFKNMWQTIRSGQVWQGEIKNQKKDGTFYWVYSIIAPILDNNQIVNYISIRFDITKEKQMEEQLRLEQARNLQSAKLVSLGEISAGIAHEINNPLAVIIGNLDLLSSQLNDSQKLRTSKIYQGVKRVQEIIQALSRFVNTNRSQKNPVDLSRVINHVVTLSQIKISTNQINLKIVKNCELEVMAYEPEIEQVLLTLINNAIDAVKSSPRKQISIKLTRLNDKKCILVEDSGIGIKEDVREKLFQPFFTEKRVGQGTGLGLVTARSIMREHRGDLFFVPQQPATTFVMEFEV